MTDRWAELEAKHDELRMLQHELKCISSGPLYGCARNWPDMSAEQVYQRIRELESELGLNDYR